MAAHDRDAGACAAESVTEYLRPWKLVTFAIGLGLLVLGALTGQAIDWDVPISIIMATLTYLTAPWSLRVVLERRWRQLPAMLVVTWFCVDGCYWLYWRAVDPHALEAMRSANFPASLALYFLCGAIWWYRGSLREFWTGLRTEWRALARRRTGGAP